MRSAGDLLGPIVAKPFLSYNVTVFNETLVNKTVYQASLLEVFQEKTSKDGQDFQQNSLPLLPTTEVPKNYTTIPGHIEYPYLMVTGMVTFVGLCFMVLSCIKVPSELVAMRTKEITPIKEMLHPRSCTGNTALSVQLLLLIFLYYTLHMGLTGVKSFIPAMAIEGVLHFTKPVAANILIAYMAAVVAGAFVSVAVSKVCPVHFMIFAQIFSTTAVLIVNSFIGFKTKLYFWIFNCAFAFCSAPLTATGMGWMSRYMTFTAMVMVVIDLGRGVGGFVASWVFGYLLQHYGPQWIIYAALSCAGAMNMVIIAMQLLVYCNGKGSEKSSQDLEAKCINED